MEREYKKDQIRDKKNYRLEIRSIIATDENCLCWI